MKIHPIASDSLGIRSMATYLETKDIRIMIDPSAALGPKRYSLPPTEQELQTYDKFKQVIAQTASNSDVLIITHYHFDHYDPFETFYTGKKVFTKDVDENINKTQKKRGSEFKTLVNETCDLIYCDDSHHQIGRTKIRFSQPFFHGPENIRLGYVIMTLIDDSNKKLLYSSDVQGPVTQEATEFIIDSKPDLLILDGPPTNLLGFRFSRKNLQKASDNLVEILHSLNCEIILDHHLLRDLKYRENFLEPYRVGKKRIKTFAEYLGKENNTLEAHRKELWGK